MEMKKIRQGVKLAMLAAIAASMAYCTYGYTSAETRVKTWCAQIAPGMPLAELQSFAREHGLGPIPRDSGIRYLVESRTFGRYGCKLELDNGVVKTSTYHFAD